MHLDDGVGPAVDKAIALGIADSAKLGLMGHSYGGFSVYGLVTQTHRYKAAVALSGITDLVSIYGIFDAHFTYSDPAYSATLGSWMYEHWQAGEYDQARDLHFALHPVTDVIFTETNPAAAKWVLAQAGLIGSGFVRPPLVPLTEAGQVTGLRLLKEGAPVLDGPVAKVAAA